MRCPVCRSRSKIIRTRPDPDDVLGQGYTKMCRDPACGTIFTTFESIISVIDTDENTKVDRIFSAISQLSDDGIHKVEIAIHALKKPGKAESAKRT